MLRNFPAAEYVENKDFCIKSTIASIDFVPTLLLTVVLFSPSV